MAKVQWLVVKVQWLVVEWLNLRAGVGKRTVKSRHLLESTFTSGMVLTTAVIQRAMETTTLTSPVSVLI
jgi:hypothetical protein